MKNGQALRLEKRRRIEFGHFFCRQFRARYPRDEMRLGNYSANEPATMTATARGGGEGEGGGRHFLLRECQISSECRALFVARRDISRRHRSTSPRARIFRITVLSRIYRRDVASPGGRGRYSGSLIKENCKGPIARPTRNLRRFLSPSALWKLDSFSGAPPRHLSARSS